jgi:hypothetical protein
MSHRFCSRCNADVEDAGGYCLLGHDLRLEAPVDSLKALRDEVNRTFDEARRELAGVIAPAVAAPTPMRAQPVRLDEALVLEGPTDVREWSDAPAAAAAPEAPIAAHHSVFEGLDEEPALAPGDPIASFAPSPRMDWGPRKSRLLGRRARPEEQRTGA